MFRLVDLLAAVKNNDAKTAYAIAQSWTPTEVESVAYYLDETATFL